ncbi:deuterosome assembly protein 1 isoform X5 [Bubalus kerabau]|uniref:deuterosome assembly protein 1 isoform X7 n=1 Tax=Bubalus bubalis TaxID=89462 RepID=UPI001D11F7DD|nr:deuterosome assembly protein 1 isoform X7 [Bubalus bubalis]XP_055437613.1 deuterosome assembly protein 1 isoform X5 [Bubalus carabanensis]
MQQFLDMENQTHNTLGASPCEAELQELMEQIDIMVNNKKLDWERKMRALETRLDLRDQELANAQTCLEQKGQEVGLLRQKLDSLEKCNLAMTQNYEGQLQTLKAQFSKLTSSFEKLRLHQMKQNKFRRKEVPHLKEEMPFELNNLNQKLEKQAQSYHTQLNGKKQSIEDSSPEIPRLVCEPDSACETSERDEFIIEKLKSAVSEIALSRNKLQDENQKLLQELKMYQRQCQIRSHLYQEEEYHSSEQERMRNEISDLTQELHQKEITIATVMKKAALLERQLKMELEIKEKMLSKQQMLDTRYKAVRTENTHLKGMMGDLDPGRYMSVDFTNREHSRHTSINKLEYENERLRNDLAKLHASGKSTWANQNTYEEAGRFNHDREPNRSATPPLPSLPFQTKEITSPLVSDEEVFPMSPPDISFPASLATQHFLLEEEKRAKELEKLLNTHIDELQRHTGFTLNKYTKLKQNRHM